LIQKHWAHDFSIGSRLVLDEVTGIFRFGTSGITAHLTEGTAGGGGRSITGRRRHWYTLVCFCWDTVVWL